MSMDSNLDALFSKMENFITTKTVVGEPVHIGDVILIPLVDVVFGVGTGTGQSDNEKTKGEAGAGGLGAKITPSAVIAIVNGTVQMVNVKNQDSVNKLIDMVPGILSKLNLNNIFKKDKIEEHADKDIVFESEHVTE